MFEDNNTEFAQQMRTSRNDDAERADDFVKLTKQIDSPQNDSPEQICNLLEHLINGLVKKGFTFVTSEYTAHEMQQQIMDFDNWRLWLTGKVFGLSFNFTDLPGFVGTISKNLVGFGVEQVEDADLAALQELMRSSFPFCAINFSKLWGPRFVPILNGDNLPMCHNG